MAKIAKKKARKRNPSTGQRAVRAALKKAEAFYGSDELVNEARELKSYVAPEAFIDIGELESIVYRSTKFDGVSRSYEHEVTRKRRLLISVDGSTMIVDPPLKITKRGIEG